MDETVRDTSHPNAIRLPGGVRPPRRHSAVIGEHVSQLTALVAVIGLLITATYGIWATFRNPTSLVGFQVGPGEVVRFIKPVNLPEDRHVVAITRDLAQVIEWVRTVPGERDLLKANWSKALAFMAPDGVEMLKAHGREVRPDELAKQWRVRVEILDVQPVTKGSYVVEWVEKFYQMPTAEFKEAKRYRTVLSFRLEPPETDSEQARLNPFGVKIYDAHWHPQPDRQTLGVKPAIRTLKGGN